MTGKKVFNNRNVYFQEKDEDFLCIRIYRVVVNAVVTIAN